MAHEKMVRDGMVAILYSPGFGAGWSSWGQPWMATDKRLVETFEAGAHVGDVAEQIAAAEHDSDYICVLAANELALKWLPVGTRYFIDEYDGSESVRTEEVLDQTA